MTRSVDQSVENLRMLCELLRVTNPVLESGGSELDQLGHSLKDSVARLSEELDHLAADLDHVQKEAETTEAAAVSACQDLGHVAEHVNASTLAEVEKEAAAAQEHWTEVLKEKSSALEAAFEDLGSHGFEPLGATLANEQASFEKWTQAADDTLQGLAVAIGSVEEGVAHQGTVLYETARDLEGAPPLAPGYWHGLDTHARAIAEETVPQFGEQVKKHSDELYDVHEELLNDAKDRSTNVREDLEVLAKEAVLHIDANDVELMHAVEAATEALNNAQIEFERGAVQAEDAEKEGHELDGLSGHVAEAQVQLHQIHDALEAMGQ